MDEKELLNQNLCPALGYQEIDVCVPVTIKPFGDAGDVTTQCMGEPVISSNCEGCTGYAGRICKFTVSQKLRVEVPIMFGADAVVGEALVDCPCEEQPVVDPPVTDPITDATDTNI